MNIIYTIGHTESYDEYLKSWPCYKKGKTFIYLGGCAFQTIEEAKQHCANGYSVYLLAGEWDRCTIPGEDYYHIIVDLQILKKVI